MLDFALQACESERDTVKIFCSCSFLDLASIIFEVEIRCDVRHSAGQKIWLQNNRTSGQAPLSLRAGAHDVGLFQDCGTAEKINSIVVNLEANVCRSR